MSSCCHLIVLPQTQTSLCEEQPCDQRAIRTSIRYQLSCDQTVSRQMKRAGVKGPYQLFSQSNLVITGVICDENCKLFSHCRHGLGTLAFRQCSECSAERELS